MPRPPLLDLLAAFRARRTDFPLERLDPAHLAWAIESGLAPLIARTCGDLPTRGADADAIRGADLAARIVSADQTEATVELIDACAPIVGPLTLLKGIWLGQALYPEPHLRPMRDVDVLVEAERVPDVEERLRALGYEPIFEPGMGDYSGHHHAPPYRHPDTAVVFEVHRGLVPARGPFGAAAAFAPERVRSELRPDSFHGRAVHRLSDELQVSYLSAHWSSSFKVIGGAGGLLVLLDLLALVDRVDWQRAMELLRGSPAARSLRLLLGYLETRGLLTLSDAMCVHVRDRSDAQERASLAALRWLVDRRVAEGTPYGRLLFTRHTFEIVWKTLLRPGSTVANVAALPWRLVAGRWREDEAL